jgi:predicted SAM-dependent methyltransferase
MKLHIGGTEPHPDWTILDAIHVPGVVDIVAQAHDIPLEDGTVDALYASHVFEHFPLAQAHGILQEWCRVLKPGGKIMVSVPDMPTLAHLYLSEPSPELRMELTRIIFGGQTTEYDFHYYGWEEISLKEFMLASGFVDVRRVDFFRLFKDSSMLAIKRMPISLNMEAYKESVLKLPRE